MDEDGKYKNVKNKIWLPRFNQQVKKKNLPEH